MKLLLALPEGVSSCDQIIDYYFKGNSFSHVFEGVSSPNQIIDLEAHLRGGKFYGIKRSKIHIKHIQK